MQLIGAAVSTEFTQVLSHRGAVGRDQGWYMLPLNVEPGFEYEVRHMMPLCARLQRSLWITHRLWLHWQGCLLTAVSMPATYHNMRLKIILYAGEPHEFSISSAEHGGNKCYKHHPCPSQQLPRYGRPRGCAHRPSGSQSRFHFAFRVSPKPNESLSHPMFVPLSSFH